MGKSATSVCWLSALALAACAGTNPTEPNPNIVPANYKQEIIETLTRDLDDPTNVRDAYVTEPVLRQAGKDQRYTV